MKGKQFTLKEGLGELSRINKEQADILNTIPTSIVLLDKNGIIIKVNQKLILAGRETGIPENFIYPGKHFSAIIETSLDSGKETVELISEGIQEILSLKSDNFKIEYRGISISEIRWYKMEVHPLTGVTDGEIVIMRSEITDQKRTEEEMKLLINNTEESFILLDKDLKIVSFNNQFQNLYKKYLRLHVKKGDFIINYAQPDRKKAVMEIYQRVLKGNVEFSSIEIPISETEIKSFSMKFNPARDNFGNIFGVFVTAADITEIKQAELLKEFEKRDKEALINSTDDLIWSVSKEFNLIAANNSFHNSLKYFSGKTLQAGDNLLQEGVFPDDFLKLWKSLYLKALDGQTFKTEIFTDSAIRGNEMWTETSFNPIWNDSKVVAIACYSRNITDRKNTEEKIKRNEALLAEAQKLAKLGSWDFDFKANKLTWSEELYNVFGINKDTFILTHDSFVKLIDLEYRELVVKNCDNTQHTGEPFSIEYTISDAFGEQKFIQERGYGKKNKSGEVDRMFGTVQDITEQKKAEEKLINTSKELQRALNDLHKVMDSSLDVICAVNEQGFFVKVSAACKAVWGYSQEEIIGKQVFDLVFSEDHEKTRKIANKVMSGTNISHFENRYVRKDGSLVPISWAVRWDPVDKIRYGVARDITEKKRLESAFETERLQFFDLFSKAPSSMGFLKGPDHVFEMANPLYLQLMGKKDIIGKTVKEVVPEVEEQGAIAMLDHVYRTGETFTANEMHFRFDKYNNGTLVDHFLNLTYQAHKGNDDKIDGILFFAVDVTEQVVSRKKIEESEARLNEAQALAKVGNWETDLESLHVTWSAETFRIFEIDPAEFQSSHPAFIQYVHPDDVEKVNNAFFESFQTDSVNSIEHRIITPTGHEKILEERWQITKGKNNKPIRAVGTCQDITERKIAELERSKITNDLIQRNRDLEQFAFIISHNLRAPTANIIGFAENLLNESLTPEEEKDFLKGLSISVDRLDNVIKDLNKILQVRRESDGKKEIISLQGLVNDISISIENLIDKYNVIFKIDFSKVSEIYSLKGYLHSIFFNLISNSIKYRNPNVDPVIEITSSSENGKIKIIFKDNGLGIDLKSKGDKIFGLYKRFHSHVEGKGLGLFMVKTEVESLGGTINIMSEPDKGTMFTIEFQSQNKSS